MPEGFWKRENHNSISSEENENVNLPGKDAITDVETSGKEKTESCDWPYDDAKEIEITEDPVFLVVIMIKNKQSKNE